MNRPALPIGLDPDPDSPTLFNPTGGWGAASGPLAQHQVRALSEYCQPGPGLGAHHEFPQQTLPVEGLGLPEIFCQAPLGGRCSLGYCVKPQCVGVWPEVPWASTGTGVGECILRYPVNPCLGRVQPEAPPAWQQGGRHILRTPAKPQRMEGVVLGTLTQCCGRVKPQVPCQAPMGGRSSQGDQAWCQGRKHSLRSPSSPAMPGVWPEIPQPPAKAGRAA